MRALLSIRIAYVALMLLLCLAESPVASGQEANSSTAQVTHNPLAHVAARVIGPRARHSEAGCGATWHKLRCEQPFLAGLLPSAHYQTPGTE
jgi:hypothetical protein